MPEQITDRPAFAIPRKVEVLVFVLLFSLAVFLRFHHLSADPPTTVSQSTGIDTDPPQYTIHARNDVLTGDWNPYGETRYVTYRYSLVSGMSWVIYRIFGVGTYQANLVGVILSLMSLLLFYFVSRKIFDSGVALLALLFVGVNHVAVFFDRRPFLENGMIFLLVLGLFFLVYMEERWIGHILFGACIAGAVVFGKLIALAFLPVPVAYYAYRFMLTKSKRIFARFAAMLLGLAVVSGLWLLFIFLPRAWSVTGYVGEQAFGLYGYPEGLESVMMFIWKFLTLGISEAFYERMPVVGIAAAVGMILLCSRLFDRTSDGTPRAKPDPREVALMVWLAATYLAIVPWNYQPLRYQTVMIYPTAALGAALLGWLYTAWKPVNILNRSVIFTIILYVLVTFLAYQLVRGTVLLRHELFYFSDYFVFIAISAAIITVAYFILSVVRRRIEIHLPPSARYAAVALVIVGTLYYHGVKYLGWAIQATVTTREISRDLGRVLSAEAVISGPYGPALAMENELGCIIHIFGTSRPDPGLFDRLPVTHLLTDGANEAVARRIYPYMMGGALSLYSYTVNHRPVTLFQIAGHTSNERADHYNPSPYERAVRCHHEGKADSAVLYLSDFLKMHPGSIAGKGMADSLGIGQSDVAAPNGR